MWAVTCAHAPERASCPAMPPNRRCRRCRRRRKTLPCPEALRPSSRRPARGAPPWARAWPPSWQPSFPPSSPAPCAAGGEPRVARRVGGVRSGWSHHFLDGPLEHTRTLLLNGLRAELHDGRRRRHRRSAHHSTRGHGRRVHKTLAPVAEARCMWSGVRAAASGPLRVLRLQGAGSRGEEREKEEAPHRGSGRNVEDGVGVLDTEIHHGTTLCGILRGRQGGTLGTQQENDKV